MRKEDRYDERLTTFFPNKQHPLAFIQMDGVEEIGTGGTSYKNEKEVETIVEI